MVVVAERCVLFITSHIQVLHNICGSLVLLVEGMPAQNATFPIKTDELYRDFACEES
jgi:hypothetical protein